jgi:penicillin-binding protein 2
VNKECIEKIHIRCFFTYLFFISILVLLWLYTCILQIAYFSSYEIKSTKNFTRYKKLDALRGSILDCKGRIIATTGPVVRMFWKKKCKSSKNLDLQIFDFLNETLYTNLDKSFFIEKSVPIKTLIKEEISIDELSMFLERFPVQDRLELEIVTKRMYPLKKVACHAIGYIYSYDQNGATGIERMCDSFLSGESGTQKMVVNAFGEIVESDIVSGSKGGNNIITTIDLDVQNILEEILDESISGCAIVMDPDSGALRGIVSSPRFDPNMFLKGISIDEMNLLRRNNALMNRCFKALYPPASIFKLVSTIAMLEESIANSDSLWRCRGYSKYKGRRYRCNNPFGHGKINLRDAVSYSCNIPYYECAKNKLSIGVLEKYALKFGFGDTTGSRFNEEKGLVPNKEWKRKVFNEGWYTGETLSVSIGQGPLLVTPIQIAQFMGGVMTGNLVSPRILENEQIVKKCIDVNGEALEFIRDSILLGVKEGTSRVLKSLKGWKIYAKTGTAQTRSNKDNDSGDLKKKYHGSIGCYAQYNDCAPIVLVIVTENEGSGRKAARFAKLFFQKYTGFLK